MGRLPPTTHAPRAFALLTTLGGLVLGAPHALAQAGPEASFPADPPPTSAAAPAPAPAPPPPAVPPAPQASAPPPPAAASPSPTVGPDLDPAAASPTYQQQAVVEPPPPPPPQAGFPVPFSVRIDPFNWILQGQLGFELEAAVLSWLSVETVPMFVVDQTPPWLNFGGGDSRIYQKSGGWGALSGASLGVNFWPRRVFKGYVIRTGLTNYSLEYETHNDAGTRIDFVPHVRRQFYVMLGSMERWGPVTLSGGIGLGYELNKETRCYPSTNASIGNAKPGDCDELQIAVPVGNSWTPVAVTPFAYPWDILGRISLGVVID